MSELEIHLFGYPEFLIDGHPLQFKRRKTVALLAYLSVETGQGGSSPAGIGREILADLFWPDCSQEQAGAYLRQSLWECANQIGEERIIRGSGMISLDFTTGIQVDANTFDAYFRHWNFSGITSEIPTELIAEITHLYRGNFLAGFTLKNCPSFDHWQSLQVETLRHHMAQLLESCTKIWAEKGNFPQAEIFASQWLALDTINESAHRALMSIFSQTGRFSAAIRQFNTCCAILKEELEVEPEPQTLNLYRKIREHRAAGPINEADRLPAHPAEKKTNKPSGTVTFVFTDIQGSTQLWEQQKEAMQYAFQRQEEIIRSAMELHGGYVYKMIGDAFQIAFATAKGALMAALAAQRNLQSEKWDPRIGEVRVRMALHTGVTEERGDDYVGPVLNRVARLLNAGHGGQVLLTEAVYQLVRDELTSDTSLQFLDEYHLKDLITPERVYQVNGQGLNADFPPLRADSGYRSVLPFQSRPFIGRKTELGRIQEMLRDPDCRMITILGIGGSGKTRLAVRAAQESQDFQDGVCFCALENAESVQGIILAIAEEANLSLNPLPGGSITLENAREQLFQYLAGKQKLLVLDNFEHLVAYADFVSVLLEAAPRIKILVTSRQRLNLTGEWLLELGGLSYPASETQGLLQEFSAVQLFVRTAERNSTLCPGPEDWSAILRICQLLEGIPLGLEMAAAWTRTLSCLEIAEEIVRNQDFLTTSWRGMPQRHQTLRTVFEHSWRLLSGLEREVLSQLSIFQGGFSREGALIVANAPLSLIGAFVDKALIRRITSGRFEIHPLLRRYAFEKLSSNSELLNDARSRMANFYTEWLIRMNEKIKGKDHLAGLVAIRGEMANIRASLEWLVNQVDVERLSQVMPVWILYHVMNDRKFEMVQSSQLLVDLIKRLQSRANTQDISETVLLALANAAVRFFCIDRWAEVEVEQYLAESMRLIRTIPDHIYKAHALILNCVGKSSLKLAETVGYLHESIRLFEMFGDLWGCALGYMALGDLHTMAVLVPDDARVEYNRGLQDFTRVGSAWGRALCIAGLMYLEGKVGNLGESYNFGITCLAIFAEMENFERMVSIRHYLAEITEKLGRLNEASGLYQANYAYFSQQGNEAAKQYYQQKLAELACESIA